MDNRTLCICPQCQLVYWQWHKGEWTGKRAKKAAWNSASQALAEANCQVDGDRNWCGAVLCAKCSAANAPEAIRSQVYEWTKVGEEPCDS